MFLLREHVVITSFDKRRLLAFLSASGISVSIYVYVQSIVGSSIDSMVPWVIVTGVGAIALHIPIAIIERKSLQDRKFFVNVFSQYGPTWGVTCIVTSWLFALAHFIWFLFESHAASPVVENGQYVLSSRGRIVGIITHTQFQILKSLELRVFSAIMIACYLTSAVYWWFPRLTGESARDESRSKVER